MAAAAAAAARFWYNRRNLGEEINVSWNEGEDLLLHTGLTKLSEDRTIQWWYGAELISIAKISGKNPETHDVPDGRFSNRLTLNENTGDLTIKNIKTIHSGLYKLKISSNTCTGRITRYQCKRFILTVNINELKTNVGNNLEICIKGEQRNHDTILWKFGPEGRLIAKFDVSTNKTYKEVFKNSHESNLKLDDQTGSLTITNITTEHAGLYKLQINSISGTKNRKYSVTVSDPTENGENDSGMPLMNKENVDIVNEQEGTSSL
ncbi:uncharacterized protein LOC125275902 [Megalobrama amblycephala]|uniref:uncharacterized protein LOC125275902 n=1 Tax=Megalobrama amblycephala TaxID=75352 RepID=UPI00201462A0|nr:uncharacterized protein LOC125275902 [Megalobrama amblycephala]